MNNFLVLACLAISLLSSQSICSMSQDEFYKKYPWKVDQLVYVKKPDGTIVTESIYKDEDAAIPQPTKNGVSESLKKHILENMPEDMERKVRLLSFCKQFKALLIAGPAGSGKTSLASAIAHKLDQPCSFYDCRDLIGRWRNTAGSNVIKIFKPIVDHQNDINQTIIIDNLESIIKRHNDGGDNGVLALCSYLKDFEHSNHQAIVIGVTNNNIDMPWPIFYRFTNKINMELPDAKQREAAFVYHMQREPMYRSLEGTRVTYASSVTAKSLARKTSGLDHHELKRIVYDMTKSASNRAGEALLLNPHNSESQEIIVNQNDAMKTIDAKKPYTAFARKMTYYSAITGATCATIYVCTKLLAKPNK